MLVDVALGPDRGCVARLSSRQTDDALQCNNAPQYPGHHSQVSRVCLLYFSEKIGLTVRLTKPTIPVVVCQNSGVNGGGLDSGVGIQ